MIGVVVAWAEIGGCLVVLGRFAWTEWRGAESDAEHPGIPSPTAGTGNAAATATAPPEASTMPL